MPLNKQAKTDPEPEDGERWSAQHLGHDGSGMKKLLLRPSEAVELLGIGRSRVYALISCGELPSIRIGKSVRLPVTSLLEWIVARQAATADERLASELARPSSAGREAGSATAGRRKP